MSSHDSVPGPLSVSHDASFREVMDMVGGGKMIKLAGNLFAYHIAFTVFFRYLDAEFGRNVTVETLSSLDDALHDFSVAEDRVGNAPDVLLGASRTIRELLESAQESAEESTTSNSN